MCSVCEKQAYNNAAMDDTGCFSRLPAKVLMRQLMLLLYIRVRLYAFACVHSYVICASVFFVEATA